MVTLDVITRIQFYFFTLHLRQRAKEGIGNKGYFSFRMPDKAHNNFSPLTMKDAFDKFHHSTASHISKSASTGGPSDGDASKFTLLYPFYSLFHSLPAELAL